MKKTPVQLFWPMLPAVIVILFVTCGHPLELTPPAAEPYQSLLYGWRTASWSPFTVSDALTGFAYGNGVYVAVSRTGVIAWSNDGDVWNLGVKAADFEADPFAAQFNDVAYGNGVFIAVGDNGRIARSVNGKDWTAPAAGINGFGANNIYGITCGKDYFVAVGGIAGEMSWSANGETWAYCGDGNFTQINDIAYNYKDDCFYIVGNGGKIGYNETPNTSSNWHPQSPIFYGNTIRRLALGGYGGDDGVAIVIDATLDGRKLAVCTTATFRNGGGWDADIDSGLFGGNSLNGIVWGKDDRGDDNYLAAGTGSMIGFWPSATKDQNSERYWRALSFSEFNSWEISAVAVCNDRYFIGHVGGKIGYRK
jgi:hypothetical protein